MATSAQQDYELIDHLTAEILVISRAGLWPSAVRQVLDTGPLARTHGTGPDGVLAVVDLIDDAICELPEGLTRKATQLLAGRSGSTFGRPLKERRQRTAEEPSMSISSTRQAYEVHLAAHVAWRLNQRSAIADQPPAIKGRQHQGNTTADTPMAQAKNPAPTRKPTNN